MRELARARARIGGPNRFYGKTHKLEKVLRAERIIRIRDDWPRIIRTDERTRALLHSRSHDTCFMYAIQDGGDLCDVAPLSLSLSLLLLLSLA